jgi:ABC-2 type transport system ATP-binding protein
VAFVAQDAPLYANLSVGDHLRLGAHLNPRWNHQLAADRIRKLKLDTAQKAGRLSGGQRAQLALTLAAAKRAELLILDEPVASLDPLARRTFLQDLEDFVTELAVSVILSSHLLSDLARVCDYLIVLSAARVQLAGDVDELLASHWHVPSPGADLDVVHEGIVRTTQPPPGAQRIDLEDLVLAYMAAEVQQ